MSRRGLLLAGLGLLAAVWLGPLPALARHAFCAHMAMHMAVVAVAAPLVALGLAGRRLDPVRAAPRLFAPLAISAVELVVVWAWHAPALHHAARHVPGVMVAEQGTFALAGLAMWLAAFGGGQRPSASRAAAGVVGLLLTSMHMTLLGALLALAPRVLYAHAGTVFGMTALEDQQLGGALMLLGGGASYLAGGLALAARVVARPVRATTGASPHRVAAEATRGRPAMLRAGSRAQRLAAERAGRPPS